MRYNLFLEIRNMIYDYLIIDAHSWSRSIKLIWMSPRQRLNTNRSYYIGLAQACCQTRAEFLLKYYNRESVFEIRFHDISNFGTLLIENHLPAPRILNISFVPRGFPPDRYPAPYKTIDILPLLHFKKRIEETELRFSWPINKFTNKLEREIYLQAASVRRLYGNTSGIWQDLLNRQTFSEIRVTTSGVIQLFLSNRKWPKLLTEFPWMRKIQIGGPGTNLDNINLQGLRVRIVRLEN